MNALFRLVETVRRLRPSQVGHRLVRRVEAALRARAARKPWAAWAAIAPLPREARRPLGFPFDRPDADGWTFAGARARCGPAGLAWDGEPSLLARYHAGYAEVVRAFAERGDLARARAWTSAVLSSAPDHPYVRSRRILALVEARAAGVVEADATIVADAEVIVRRPEWDVRGNHLVCNAAALLRAGAAYRGRAARRWRALGASMLASCACDQVLADGVHYERSPVYQGLVLEHLLVALETCAARGEAPPLGVEDAAARLAVSLAEFSLPDGAAARWRDGAPGVALPTDGLVAWANRRAGPLPTPRRGVRAFLGAGFAIVESTDGRTAATLVAAPACPPELPAHGHADALAYEAVLDGVRVVAAAGTAAYGEGPERDRDRRPGAFAGFTIDGAAPADPYGAFRVGTRGWVRRLEIGETKGWRWAFAAAGGLAGAAGASLRRLIAVSPRGSIVVMDEWTGDGVHRVDLFAPLAPGLVATVAPGGAIARRDGVAWRLAAPGASVAVEKGVYAVAMGATVPRDVLRLSYERAFPARTLHAWTLGEGAVELVPTVLYGHEVRVVARRGGAAEDVETGYLPVGRPA